ncbi:hypothetical protein [Cohnella soli]|uniref:Uncharacterized protein n=1 Tax=Cohnella soli TaxID=425005 RepID=A0ABW0HWN4_9BACL
MLPLRNCLPYDIVMNDVFAQECPFCQSSHVLLPLKPEDVSSLSGGRRKILLVFPCCHGSVRVIDSDSDYLLADRPVRGK